MRRIVAGVLVAAAFAGACSDADDPPPAAASSSTTSTVVAPSTPATVGAELDDLVAAGRRGRYHVVYTVPAAELPAGATVTVEQWNDSGSFRSDRVDVGPAGTRRSTSQTGRSDSTVCRTVDGVQQCTTVTSTPTDLPSTFLHPLDQAEPMAELTVRDADVAGRPARCFTATGIGELCLSPGGVPLRLVLDRDTLVATTVDDDVPASTFEPEDEG